MRAYIEAKNEIKKVDKINYLDGTVKIGRYYYECDEVDITHCTNTHDASGSNQEIYEKDIVEFMLNGKLTTGYIQKEWGRYVIKFIGEKGYLPLNALHLGYGEIDCIVKGTIYNLKETIDSPCEITGKTIIEFKEQLEEIRAEKEKYKEKYLAAQRKIDSLRRWIGDCQGYKGVVTHAGD